MQSADQIREFGADDPRTLETRHYIAYRLARYGNPLHPEVIRTRFGRARVIARTGDVATAVAQMREVSEDRARVLGEDHPDTLAARAELATLLAQ
ncbi:hypothetical protein ACFZCP_00070 [Streptomyces sp. NPDC007971]|uniref:hypothetical protein n=1 Tax=Streptomyces sp. NPDC007971 TaxID=3364799 RepID=UPI0036E0E284